MLGKTTEGRDGRPRRRRLGPALERLDRRLLPATIVVTTTADDAGLSSLRAAIASMNAGADANPEVAANRSGTYGEDDVIAFALPGAGVRTIAPAAPLPALARPMAIDGYSQPGASPNRLPIGTDAILLVALDGASAGDADGLVVQADGCLIRGLAIHRFSGSGIVLAAARSSVQGNHVGTDAAGMVAMPNGRHGVSVRAGASSNLIGGDQAPSRNVISGNGYHGIAIEGPGGTANRVEGNYIGVDAAGAATLGNVDTGVAVSLGARDNVVGGAGPASGNVISGNRLGVGIDGANTVGNRVEGNTIGLDAAGSAAVPNYTGVAVGGFAADNRIGGTIGLAGNVISGNVWNGISLVDGLRTRVEGNRIGTDQAGLVAIPNGGSGILVAAYASVIGGNTPEARNVISGNGRDGVEFIGSGPGENEVLGNLIGVDVSGFRPLPNGRNGIRVSSFSGRNSIGGTTPGTRNVISGNRSHGVVLQDASVAGNVVVGNFIGLDVLGSGAIGNGGHGVLVGSSGIFLGNRIGGTAPGSGNVIAGNAGDGIRVIGRFSESTTIQGNSIGIDVDANDLPNAGDGVVLADGATGVLVGGAEPGAGNRIVSRGKGVVVGGSPGDVHTHSNRVLGNRIVAAGGIAVDLGNDGPTPNQFPSDPFPNRRQVYPVLLAADGLTVAGTLEGPPGTDYRLEFFASPRDAIGRDLLFLGAAEVSVGPKGTVAFRVVVPPAPAGMVVAATATDLATLDTSEASLALDPELAITPVALPPVTVGSPFAATIAAAGGGGGPYAFAVFAGALPAGLALDPATGAILGTPAGPAGAYDVTILVTDRLGSRNTRRYAGAVHEPIVVGPTALPPATVGRPFAVSTSATGGSGGPYTIALVAGALPPGLSLEPATGSIVGVPAVAGPYAFALAAFAAGGDRGVRDYAGMVNPAVAVVPEALPAVTAGSPFGVVLAASGGAGGPYTLAVVAGALPAGLAFDPASGVLAGTPTTPGAYAFAVRAVAAGGEAGSRTYAGTVHEAIVVGPAALPAVTAGSPFSALATAAGGSGGPYTFAVVAGALPAGLALDPATGAIAGMPTTPGPYAFALAAFAAGGTGSRAYAGAVNPAIGLVPAALPAVAVASPIRVDLTAFGGSGGPYSFAVTAGALPDGLALDPATGVLSGTPTAPGPYAFVVTATAAGADVGTRAYVGAFGFPEVVGLRRLGVHAQPTRLEIAFNTAMDPTRAVDLRNYRLVALLGVRRAVPLPIASAAYDGAARSVLLRPARRLPLHLRYALKLVGTPPGGLAAATGTPLVGAGQDRPGGDVVLPFGREALAGPGRPAPARGRDDGLAAVLAVRPAPKPVDRR